jgi:hypothetical protein
VGLFCVDLLVLTSSCIVPSCIPNPGPCSYGVFIMWPVPDGDLSALQSAVLTSPPAFSNVDQRNSTARAKYLGNGTNNLGELSGVQRVLQLVRRWAENKKVAAATALHVNSSSAATATSPMPTPSTPLRPLHLFTDSAYSVGVITGTMGASSNLDIIQPIRVLIRALRKEHSIDTRIQWVPAHVGIACNEMADKLANEVVKGHPLLANPDTDNITRWGRGFSVS